MPLRSKWQTEPRLLTELLRQSDPPLSAQAREPEALQHPATRKHDSGAAWLLLQLLGVYLQRTALSIASVPRFSGGSLAWPPGLTRESRPVGPGKETLRPKSEKSTIDGFRKLRVEALLGEGGSWSCPLVFDFSGASLSFSLEAAPGSSDSLVSWLCSLLAPRPGQVTGTNTKKYFQLT